MSVIKEITFKGKVETWDSDEKVNRHNPDRLIDLVDNDGNSFINLLNKEIKQNSYIDMRYWCENWDSVDYDWREEKYADCAFVFVEDGCDAQIEFHERGSGFERTLEWQRNQGEMEVILRVHDTPLDEREYTNQLVKMFDESFLKPKGLRLTDKADLDFSYLEYIQSSVDTFMHDWDYNLDQALNSLIHGL